MEPAGSPRGTRPPLALDIEQLKTTSHLYDFRRLENTAIAVGLVAFETMVLGTTGVPALIGSAAFLGFNWLGGQYAKRKESQRRENFFKVVDLSQEHARKNSEEFLHTIQRNRELEDKLIEETESRLQEKIVSIALAEQQVADNEVRIKFFLDTYREYDASNQKLADRAIADAQIRKAIASAKEKIDKLIKENEELRKQASCEKNAERKADLERRIEENEELRKQVIRLTKEYEELINQAIREKNAERKADLERRIKENEERRKQEIRETSAAAFSACTITLPTTTAD